MKKAVFFFIALFFTITVFANSGFITRVGIEFVPERTTYVDNFKKHAHIWPEPQPLCRGCCTITVTSMNGQTLSQTACTSNSDCTVAAVNACTAARIAIAARAFQ